ncbi:hypothetical protein YC2023_015533 [Brassica napus]
MEDRKALHLAEFAYIDNYRSSIEMAPYEAIYGRPCRIPLCWTKDWLWDAHDDRGFMQLSVILLGMAKPCRNVTVTATNSHHEREAILPSEKRESDPRTVNFISVLPLIQKEPENGQDIIGKISMPAFQIIYPIVKSTYVCVYDQPGDEATLVKQMVSDRTLPEYHIDLISESSGVALLEPSRSIRRFLRFLQNLWQRDYVSGRGSRDVWTSDAALVGGGLETSGLATQIVWGVGAETFAFDAALEGGGELDE